MQTIPSFVKLEPPTLSPWSLRVRDLLMNSLGDARGVHLETAVTGIAAVAGCLLLRSTNINLDRLQSGQAIFSEAVNELGPKYFDFLVETCASQGIEPQRGWTDLVPADHQPLRSIAELTRLLEPAYLRLCEKLQVPTVARTQLALFTAVSLIKEGHEMLPLELGKALILAALVAGSKTVPTPLAA